MFTLVDWSKVVLVVLKAEKHQQNHHLGRFKGIKTFLEIVSDARKIGLSWPRMDSLTKLLTHNKMIVQTIGVFRSCQS